MKLIFENHCTYTYEYYLQLKRKTMDRGAQNTGYVFLVIFAVLFAVCMIKGWYAFSLAPLVAVAFLIYRLFLMPVILARFSARKNREVHGKDVETVNRFYEDHVLAVNTLSKTKTSIEYEQVRQLLTTKDLYIIGMDKGLVLLIDRNGFTLGTAEDFETFIKEKCVNAEVRL
ncbi:MAG: YcxB family protein [Emergencia sp.]|nr:YcxB family protein [Emergencia sp.]